MWMPSGQMVSLSMLTILGLILRRGSGLPRSRRRGFKNSHYIIIKHAAYRVAVHESAIGTKRTIQPHPRLSALGVTADKYERRP